MGGVRPGTMKARIGEHLPYLRRYARALTGSRDVGDSYASATLEAVLEDENLFDTTLPANIALFKVFHSIWLSSGASFIGDGDGLAALAQNRFATLTSGAREALLLHTIENLPHEDVGSILGIASDEAKSLVDIALSEMAKDVSGKVLVVEDQAIIALDLEAIVCDMGHRVVGVARTASAAISLFEKEQPDLLLSEVSLADGSSGIDAVTQITKQRPDLPVIYITAHPEKLLTGDGGEPTFVIAKPYAESQIRSAVSQAMFFNSMETLSA